jgi:hypothetical protein
MPARLAIIAFHIDTGRKLDVGGKLLLRKAVMTWKM